MQPETRVSVRMENVAAKVIEGEAIIINIANGLYYSLAGVGCEVWSLIEDGCSIGQIVGVISQRYGVPVPVVEADLSHLVQQLLDENLVSTTAVDSRVGSGALPSPVGDLFYAAPELQVYRDMADLLALDPPMPGLQLRPASIDAPAPPVT